MLQSVDRLLPVLDRGHAMAALAERGGEELAIDRRVLGHENPKRARRRARRRRRWRRSFRHADRHDRIEQIGVLDRLGEDRGHGPAPAPCNLATAMTYGTQPTNISIVPTAATVG